MTAANEFPSGASTDESLRLFIAVAVPPAVRQGLAELRRPLEDAGAPASLRWVRPEGIHLTLKFLGETAGNRVATITAAIEEAASASAPHTLHIDRLGLFGGRRPRVLWAGLNGDVNAVRQAAARIDAALARRGFAPERKPFAPHLTLARLRDRATTDDRQALQRAVDRLLDGGWKSPAASAIPVTALHLIRSRLGPNGARYESLAAIALRGPAHHN